MYSINIILVLVPCIHQHVFTNFVPRLLNFFEYVHDEKLGEWGYLFIISNWKPKLTTTLTTSTFFPQDIIAIGIAAGGYFCGALPMAVYAGQWGDGSLKGVNGTSAVQSSASATSVSYYDMFQEP